MPESNELNYTCLFGGGAIRGAAHVGVVKALDELGVCSNIIGGSSVGSIVAALYSVGYKYDELAEIFLSVNFELFRDISFGFNSKFALSKGEVFLDWIRELIEKKFYADKYDKDNNEHVKFKDVDKNLVIITTDIKNFKCCEFSKSKTPDFEIAMAVRISCCMPGLMRAVSLDDKLLVDGDLMKGKPMWTLSDTLKNSDDRILEIRLEGEFSGDDKNPLSYVNGMYSCITYSETDFIKNIYKYSDDYDYLVINTGDVVVVDFNYPQNLRQTIIDRGYELTYNYFKNDLVDKKKRLLKSYNDLFNQLLTVKNLIVRGKYLKAKNEIAYVFIILSDLNNVIDKKLLKDIKFFQATYFSNVKTGLLGYSYCSNLKSIIGLLQEIIEKFDYKIAETKKYISKFSV